MPILLSVSFVLIGLSCFTRTQQLNWSHRFWCIAQRWRELKPELHDWAKLNRRERQRLWRWRALIALWAGITRRVDITSKNHQPEYTVVATFGDRAYFIPVYKASTSPSHHSDFETLESYIAHYPNMSRYWQWRARNFMVALVRHRGAKGRITDLVAARSKLVRLYMGAYAKGLYWDKFIPLMDPLLSSYREGRACYNLPNGSLPFAWFNKEIAHYTGLLGGKTVVRGGSVPGSVELRRLIKFDPTVALRPQDLARLSAHLIALGLCRLSGKQVTMDIMKMYHTLICGSTRWGKTVLLHLIMTQLVTKSKDLVEKIVVGDLKGVELRQYAREHPQLVEVVEDIDGVMTVVAVLKRVLTSRRAIMARRGWRNWRGARIFFIIDEAAMIAQYRVAANDLDGRFDKEVMNAELLELSQQAAGAGIIIITALQKATADTMDPTIRSNIENKFCFHVESVDTATRFLGMPPDSMTLNPCFDFERGDCVYLSPSEEGPRYVKVYFPDSAKDDPNLNDNDNLEAIQYDDISDLIKAERVSREARRLERETTILPSRQQRPKKVAQQ